MPASSVRPPDHQIQAAFQNWKRAPRGRTADDLAEALGISKSTLYKVAGKAGLLKSDNLDAGYHDRLQRIESMLEYLVRKVGDEEDVPAPLERGVTLQRKAAAVA